MTTTYYAAIDSTDPLSGAVYGVGASPEAALADAERLEKGAYDLVSITPAAYEYVMDRGGAPSRELSVSRRGVYLRHVACCCGEIADGPACQSEPQTEDEMIPVRWVPRDLRATHDAAPVPMRHGFLDSGCLASGMFGADIAAGYVVVEGGQDAR